MEKREYELSQLFIEKYHQEIEEGKEIQIEIRDHFTYEGIKVKAVVSLDPEKIPDGDILWIRNLNEMVMPDPGAIKIVEELDEDVEIRIRPKEQTEYLL